MNKNNIYSKILIVAMAVMTVALPSCIKNDIPYPTIQLAFLSMTAEGETSAAVISQNERTVTLNLGETVDLSNVVITDYKITDQATLSTDIQNGINLKNDLDVTLSLYQDYKWTIKANQVIDRYFNVLGQVGASVIDVPAKRMVAYIPKTSSRNAVTVESLKIGPEEISTMMPDYNGQTADFSQPKTVKVTYQGVTEEWTLFVEHTETTIALSDVNAWTNVIWAYGTAQAGKNNGFEYRKQGSEDWIKVEESAITNNGGNFSTCIPHLAASTSYEIRAYSDSDYSAVTTVMTDGTAEIPNGSFDEWWKDGKVWCPWTEGGTAFWGTGNKGATTLGDSNTFPSTDTWDGGTGNSAELDTKFVGIGAIGKLAAGNMFSGDYVKTDGTNGILDFGRAFNKRPTKMKGYWKYKCVNITHTSSEYSDLMGRPDTAAVYIALTNWAAPYEIRTRPSNRQLFDKNADYVIAYGEVLTGKNIDDWTEFTCNLKYNRTNENPSYIVIVSSASKYGDFFTGGNGSILWIDNFWLEWDY